MATAITATKKFNIYYGKFVNRRNKRADREKRKENLKICTERNYKKDL